MQRGKRQEYELETFLRQRYETLLGNGTYLPDKVFTKSSDFKRTIDSAAQVLTGLFPLQNYRIWNKKANRKPFPLYIIPKKSDYLLSTIHLHVADIRNCSKNTSNHQQSKQLLIKIVIYFGIWNRKRENRFAQQQM